MFYWPHLELTEYEKLFVGRYSELLPVLGPDKKPIIDPATGRPRMWRKPGVLRRTYRVILNNTIILNVPEYAQIHLEGALQIARRSRVLGLSFSGDAHAWRLRINTASGEEYTPRLAGGTYPVVSAMVPGTSWNITSTDMAGPSPLVFDGAVDAMQIAWMGLPLIIEPNWELVPNESLFFTGEPLTTDPILLEIAVHVWEFPGMVQGAPGPDKGQTPRMGGGISC